VTDQRQLNLPLFALGAVAAHAVVLAALLPMLVTLPGPGSSPRGPLIIDVDVTPGASPAPLAPQPEPSIPADTATTSALPEPSRPAPAETAAAIAADPMTTQSTAPMADAGQASAVLGAESVGAPSDSAKTHEDAGLPARPHAGAAPAPSLARAEPPETLPPAVPATNAATEQATANAPKAEVPKPVAAPAAKKATAVRAQPVTPRANRVVKAKPKAPTPGADFKSLFSGTILAPTIPKDQRATR
jgi:hypothetical protein